MRLKSTATLNQNCDFLAGFYPSAGYFFTFYLICIASMILMSAVYRLLAAASPNMDIASATGASQSKPRSLLPLTMAVLAFCGNTSALVLHKGLSMGQALFLPKVASNRKAVCAWRRWCGAAAPDRDVWLCHHPNFSAPMVRFLDCMSFCDSCQAAPPRKIGALKASTNLE